MNADSNTNVCPAQPFSINGAMFFDGDSPVLLFSGGIPGSKELENRLLDGVAGRFEILLGRAVERDRIVVSRPVGERRIWDAADFDMATAGAEGGGMAFAAFDRHCRESGLISETAANSIVIQAVEIYRMRSFAFTDFLTGLRNRRYIEISLLDDVERSRRYGLPLAVAMLDIDNFRECNLAYGHAYGDQVLREYSQTLRGALRESDMIARYGGDEFLLVLPMTDRRGAETLVGRLSAVVAESGFTGGGRPTFSVGIAIFGADADGDSKAELLLAADRRLLAAKARNSVGAESD